MDYIAYLKSSAWLLKKNEIINYNIKAGMPIKCWLCGSTDNLQFHHNNYENIGKEIPSDIDIYCADCHSKWHKDAEWKDKKLKEIGFEFIAILENIKK